MVAKTMDQAKADRGERMDYLRFYQGRIKTKQMPDVESKSISELLSLSDSELFENRNSNNYLQWAFPLPELSKAMPGAVDTELTEMEATRMMSDHNIKEKIQDMLAKVLGYWGIAFTMTAEDFQMRIGDKGVFLRRMRNVSNQKRLSRILNFLYCTQNISFIRQADTLKEIVIEGLENYLKPMNSETVFAIRHWQALTPFTVWPYHGPAAAGGGGSNAAAAPGKRKKADDDENDDFLEFYQNKIHTKIVIDKNGQPTGGFSIHQMLRFTEDEMENCHNYVQWAFPNPTPSKQQKDAADHVLTEMQADRMLNDANVMMGVKQMMLKVLAFWGIGFLNSERNTRMTVFVRDPKTLCAKLSGKDHNQSRFTRFLTFLYCMRMNDLAEKLMEMIKEEMRVNSDFKPNDRTLKIWQDLVRHTDCENVWVAG